jgi:hypothetical protein
MLPPTDFDNNVCTGASAGILYWDGTTAIKCIPNSSGDASGQVNVNTLGISGATQGALNGASSDTANNLRNLPVCQPGEVLSKTTATSFSCVGGANGPIGGTYTVNLDGSCRYPDQYTRACSCPNNESATQIFDFANPTCANGYYSDGWRRSNCGIVTYLCLAQ